MSYKYLPGFPAYPIKDLDNLLETYEHIGKEIRVHTLSFIGRVNGLLHRLNLEPSKQIQEDNKVIYYPILIPLNRGEVVDVATHQDILVLASGI